MSDPQISPRHTNRLIHESSPYLLQHAHNPVDWHAWGPEALEKARREDKPIFLSVGYSTCYWCHVMERQSFENEAVAAEMNRLFVNVKVDREERPDVDQLYMIAVQLLTRHGGWPMSVWLTPDLKPFYGGTYFPPDRFVATLRALEDAYRNRRAEVDQSSEQIVGLLRRLSQPLAPEQPIRVDQELIESLVARSIEDYEPQFGGFGAAPKFPRQTLLELLLSYLHDRQSAVSQSQIANRKSQISSMLRHTLDAMADGGIRDHLGGGFHRYSTDARWLVPHFEIMLYDNAMLGWIYVEAHRQFNEPRYAQVARGIFDFILREMTSPQGAFHTAFDAEVDAREGLSYLWTAEEIASVLGPIDAKLFNQIYGLDRGPNFADPHHGSGTPDRNILFLPHPLAEAAAALGISAAQLDGQLQPMRERLYAARGKRKQPLLDTKVITSWNALMVRALAHGGKVLDERRYLDAAALAAEFLLDRHRLPDGGLYRASRDGAAKHHGFLDDYAFLAQALIALAQASGELQWKRHAAAIAAIMLQKFGDDESGGLFFSDASASDLIVRQKTAQDSPLPSGNAIAARVLLELGQSKGCLATVAAFTRQLGESAESMSSMVETAMLYLGTNEPFTVSASEGTPATQRPSSPQDIAAGVVAFEPRWMSAAELHLRLSILEGFHINAHETSPGIPLIATTIGVDAPGASVEYPPGEERRFAFVEAPIRIYRENLTIVVRFSPPVTPESQVRLRLSYQACDESACFPPVNRQIELEVPSPH